MSRLGKHWEVKNNENIFIRVREMPMIEKNDK
jgi:hypothetical protein